MGRRYRASDPDAAVFPGFLKNLTPHDHLLSALSHRPHQAQGIRALRRDLDPARQKFSGQHHGYFLPSEGANKISLALFSFPSLALYESNRARSFEDPDCQAAFRYAEETRCIPSYERSFFRPVFV